MPRIIVTGWYACLSSFYIMHVCMHSRHHLAQSESPVWLHRERQIAAYNQGHMVFAYYWLAAHSRKTYYQSWDKIDSGGAEADSSSVNSMLLGWQPSHRYRRCSVNMYNDAVVDLIRFCNVFPFVMFAFGMIFFFFLLLLYGFLGFFLIIWNSMIKFCILMFVGVRNWVLLMKISVRLF